MSLQASRRHVLVLNAGSSSLKFAVFVTQSEGLDRVLHGQVEGIGTEPRIAFGVDAAHGQAAIGEAKRPPLACATHKEALDAFLSWIALQGIEVRTLLGVGHRIVHGGSDFTQPIVVCSDNLAALDAVRALAPLHNSFGLEAVHAMLAAAPSVPQVACFDTAFHASQPDVATRFALPASFHERGYRRYGFHGLNYEHVIAELARISGGQPPPRVLAFHLGNGCSICAIGHGRSAATTMGYSTLDGLVMGTRCGSIDPGVLIALLRDTGMSVDELEALLYRKSGLLGLSGVTSDMRGLLARSAAEPESAMAVEHFCYWAARHAGSLLVALGGLDAVVFTGGIGANAPQVRAKILARMGWLGLAIDAGANEQNSVRISSSQSARSVWAMPADEEKMIALHTVRTLPD
jgi:acetate kinase